MGLKNNEVIYLIFLINLDFFIYIDKIDLPAIHCFVFKIILSQNVCSNSSIIQILMFRYFMKMLHSKMRLQEKNVSEVVHFFLISKGIEKKCPTFIEQGLFWAIFVCFIIILYTCNSYLWNLCCQCFLGYRIIYLYYVQSILIFQSVNCNIYKHFWLIFLVMLWKYCTIQAESLVTIM